MGLVIFDFLNVLTSAIIALFGAGFITVMVDALVHFMGEKTRVIMWLVLCVGIFLLVLQGMGGVR